MDDFSNTIILGIGFLAVLTIWKGIYIVPQQSAWVVEKLGSFDRVLEPGLQFLFPYVERVAYKHSLKEYAHDVQEQTAITRDNVTLVLDGVIYLRIIDPYQASYGVSDPVYAVTQLAQTTMRSEIGKLALDESFEERERLNANIVTAINIAAQTWGIQCMRYEIKNISPPVNVLKAMELQMSAERQKRAEILQSEGARQSQINAAEGRKREVELIAEARKQEVVLASEAALTDQVNRAKGEAEAILAVAEATAKGIQMVAESITKQGGEQAVALRVAEQYVGAFSQLAQKGTTILLPANAGDAGGMVAQALAVFDTIKNSQNNALSSTTGPWQKPHA
jgi:regulator of protease activity HflC (stomatin/prohibitin superfamily)